MRFWAKHSVVKLKFPAQFYNAYIKALIEIHAATIIDESNSTFANDQRQLPPTIWP
jgi:hypothetical protein